MSNRLLELLYRSFDHELTAEEQEELKAALASSAELREEERRLREIRQLLRAGAARSFRPFFSARVMNRLKRADRGNDAFISSLVWAFRRVAVAGVLAILLLVAGQVVIFGSRSVDAVLGLPQPTLEETWQLQNPLVENE